MNCLEKPLYKVIYENIFDKIKRGDLKEGDRIPSEIELAKMFNVSRITTKKALDLLSEEELIQRIQGKGSFVKKVAAEQRVFLPEVTSSATRPLTVGLIISDFSESYGVKLVKQIEKEVAKLKGHLYLKISLENVFEEEKAIEDLLAQGVDGLIIFPVHGENYNTRILELVLNQFPLVLIDRYLRGIQASSVSTDNLEAAKVATEYLLQLGHKDIAYLAPPEDGTTVLADRLYGYQSAFERTPQYFHPEYILTSSVSDFLVFEEQGDQFKEEFETIKEFIVKNPSITAFFACRYSLALVLQSVIESLGRKVPDDYSIICFDTLTTHIGTPRFTHILQDELEIAIKAVALLREKMNGKNEMQKELVDFHLIKGQSTKGI